MHPGIRQFINFTLVITFFVSATACTTTTKSLTTTEPRIESASQLGKARQAFNQKNYEQAASLLTPLAEQGDADAQYALGYMYHNGLGVPRNYKLAIQWMTAASAKGNQKATEALRRLSELGSDVTDDNLQEPVNQPVSEPDTEQPVMISGRQTETPAATTESEAAPAEDSGKAVAEAKPQPQPQPTVPSTTEPAKTASQESNPDTEAETTLTSDEKWIMAQPDSNYTLQLIATGNEKALIRFVNENNLHNSAKYYKTLRNKKDWYTLIQGSYDSSASAKQAIKALSPGLQDMNPWVKPIKAIQKALSSR